MPEGVGYGPQFTASTGLSLNYVGNHVYGNSGAVTNAGGASADTQMLLFTTGSQYIIATIDFSSRIASTNEVHFEVSFNGEIIIVMKEDDNVNWPYNFNILIPPFTKVGVKWGSNASSDTATTVLVGKLYGKVD